METSSTGNIPTISLGAWNRLGSRTYWLFLSQKLEYATGFLILAVIFTAVRGVSAIPAPVVPFVGLAGVVCFIVFFIALAIAIVASRLAYRSYEYCIDEDALKIRQGIMNQQEIAIPYRQIQTVDIERKLGERLMGLSRVVILTAAEDNGRTEYNESEGALPAMDQKLAAVFRDELLKRANVQKVVSAI
ncbi:MAG TPA: PH domain-containing protein [Candidatus Paceibacterota bacterium]|nr:PH domain-containing protein [Candidatus Paceibacterota bacterium]